MLKNVIGVTGLSLVASLFGLINQMIFAKLFGAGEEMDAFFAILAIPSALVGAAPVVLAGVIIPALKNCGQMRDEQVKFSSAIFRIVLLSSILVTVCGILVSPLVVRLMVSRISNIHYARIIFTSELLWVMAGLSIIAAYLAALHNSVHNFIIVAITTLFPSLFILASVVILADRCGILAIPIGLAVGSFMQVAILLPFVLKHSLIKWKFENIPLKRLLSLSSKVVAVCLSLLPFTAYPVISIYWASKLTIGSASYLGYSQSFAGFMSVAIGYGLSIVALPRLADNMSSDNYEEMKFLINKNLNFIFLVGMIIAGLLVVQAPIIIKLLLGRGAFAENDVIESIKVVRWYFLAAVFIACMNFLRNAYYAAMSYRSLAIQSVTVTGVYCILSGVLSKVFAVSGIGLAFAAIWGANLFFAIKLYRCNNRSILYNSGFVKFMFKVLLLCSVASLFSWFMLNIIMPSSIPLSLKVVVSVLVYAGALISINKFFFRLKELEVLARPLMFLNGSA